MKSVRQAIIEREKPALRNGLWTGTVKLACGHAWVLGTVDYFRYAKIRTVECHQCTRSKSA